MTVFIAAVHAQLAARDKALEADEQRRMYEDGTKAVDKEVERILAATDEEIMASPAAHEDSACASVAIRQGNALNERIPHQI